MLPVSNQYISSMQQQLRGYSYERITLKIVNVQAIENGEIQVTDNDGWLSHPHTILNDVKAEGTYATLEPYRFILYFTQDMIPPSNLCVDRGYISNTLSDGNGAWAVYPTIILGFDEDYDFAGLTFTFDTPVGEYISKMRITTYNLLGTKLSQQVVEPDGPIWVYELGIKRTSKIVVECMKSSHPYRRARIRSILLGQGKDFTGAELASTNKEDEVDPLARRLPTESFQFTIWDLEKQFDPDNKIGYWAYVDQLQPLTQQMGYRLPNGEIEWLPETSYLLDGSPTKSDLQISFTANKRLYTLNGMYQKGVVPSAPVSLYALAESVLYDAIGFVRGEDLGYWSLDPILKEIKTSAPLPLATHKECLQLIAQAGMCSLYTSRTGTITMKNNWYPNAVSRVKVDSYSQYQRPVVEITPPLYGVEITKYSYTPETEIVTLYEGTQEIRGQETVWVNYSLATQATATVTGGTLVSSYLYGRGGYLTITATGDVRIVVRGKRVVQQGSSYTHIANPTISGEIDIVENELVTDTKHQQDLAKYRAKYLDMRNAYTISYRGNPELECGDAVRYETEFEKDTTGLIVHSEINFNGALSGTLIMKRIENFDAYNYTTEIYTGDLIGVM